jgi:lipopolysaccharide/colanic/teichoic acid biosynthesis glycosyltransferase
MGEKGLGGKNLGDTHRRPFEGSKPDDAVESRPPLRIVGEWHTPSGFYERWVKPVVDRFVGITLSILTLPLVIVIVLVIWAKMGRPAIFKQRRVGRFGKEFTVYKFRTMDADRRLEDEPYEHDDRRMNHKSTDDPRHTSVGRTLRKWSLDEIPQFWNVAKGEMSLVGPRPELPRIVTRYEPWQHRRHAVRPGVTGLWQISARGDVPMHEATHLDIAYVDNVTFRGDAKILFSTPMAAFGSRKGQ